MKRDDIARLGPLERKALLDDVAFLVLSERWRLGDAVRFLRAVVLRQSRPHFARLVGVSPAALQQLEDWPEANPTLETLTRVFKPFGGAVGLVFPRMTAPPARTTETEARYAALDSALQRTKRTKRRPKEGA
jgi:hypothetical protein